MTDLIEALKNAGDWVSAQDAFRRCGVVDGSDTDTIERIYSELRDYMGSERIQVERRAGEDWLRLVPSKGA